MNQGTAPSSKKPPSAACTQCKAVKILPFSCGHCWSTKYCSKTCKSQHSASGHKKQCKKTLLKRQAGDGQDGTTRATGDGSNGPTVQFAGDGRDGPVPATADGLGKEDKASSPNGDGLSSKGGGAALPSKKKKKPKLIQKSRRTTTALTNSSYTAGSSSLHDNPDFYDSDSDDFGIDFGYGDHSYSDYRHHPILGWRSISEIEWWENYSD